MLLCCMNYKEPGLAKHDAQKATPLVLSGVSGEVTPCNYPETSVNMQQHSPPVGLAQQLGAEML